MATLPGDGRRRAHNRFSDSVLRRDGGVRAFLEGVVIAGWATARVVTAALERHRARGRSGITALDAALRDWTMNEKPPDSVLEDARDALLLRFHLPAVRFHAILEGHELAFAMLDSQIVIECDGWATGGRRTA